MYHCAEIVLCPAIRTKTNVATRLTSIDTLLKNLHHDPRYAAFLKKLNLPA
jgi:hypothetical protein